MNQAGRSCRICRKKCKPNELVHIFALNVNGSNNGGDTVTYFEAIQQLTGIQVCACCLVNSFETRHFYAVYIICKPFVFEHF